MMSLPHRNTIETTENDSPKHNKNRKQTERKHTKHRSKWKYTKAHKNKIKKWK